MNTTPALPREILRQWKWRKSELYFKDKMIGLKHRLARLDIEEKGLMRNWQNVLSVQPRRL